MYKSNQIHRLFNWESETYKHFYLWFSDKYKDWHLSFSSDINPMKGTIPPVFATGNTIGIYSEVFFDFLPFEMQKGVLEIYFKEFDINIDINEIAIRQYFS